MKDDGFSDLDETLGRPPVRSNPWFDGRYVADLDLLRDLLSVPIGQGDSQETGRPAKAFDAWIASELRRAGFPAGGVWPRNRRPRVSQAELSLIEQRVADVLAALKAAEAKAGQRLKPASLRNAITRLPAALPGSANASVLGDFYAKQIDVGLSSWQRGPDILISTKTMFSAYGKNLKNRHEEAVGEVLSLRRRHPMATIGYAYLVRQDILGQPRNYATLLDILTRLRRPGETFDATLLVVIDWPDPPSTDGVTLLDQPAPELGADRFFEDVVESVLERSPISQHPDVRMLRGPDAQLGIADLVENMAADDLLDEVE